MRRGDVIRVRATTVCHGHVDGLADVTATDGERIEVFFRATSATLWCEVHGSTLVTHRGRRFAWSSVDSE